MRKISTKYFLYQNVCSSCTTPMYINIIQCAKIYHQWNVSTICQHVHLPICQPCQPCASTNMPNNVHLPICQTSVISLMICLHHEPSAIIMYLNQSSVSTMSSKHIPSMSVPNMYITTCTKKVHQPCTNACIPNP